MIDKLAPVGFTKGSLIIREGEPAGPMYVIEKGRARVFAGMNGRERNLAFYREGDFFGELSILNGSPRAASVEAFTDCKLLSLDPQAVHDLRTRFPEFEKLLGERLAIYQAKTEARIPGWISRAKCCPPRHRCTTRFSSTASSRGKRPKIKKSHSLTKKVCSGSGLSEYVR